MLVLYATFTSPHPGLSSLVREDLLRRLHDRTVLILKENEAISPILAKDLKILEHVHRQVFPASNTRPEVQHPASPLLLDEVPVDHAGHGQTVFFANTKDLIPLLYIITLISQAGGTCQANSSKICCRAPIIACVLRQIPGGTYPAFQAKPIPTLPPLLLLLLLRVRSISIVPSFRRQPPQFRTLVYG